MVVPNQRDPDQTTIIRQLRTELAALKSTVIGRWGRVPHLSADPASPPNGSLWIRDDAPSTLKARTGGASFGLQLGSMVAYTPATTNVTIVGSVAGWYAQFGPIGVAHIRSISCTATGPGYTTYALPTGWAQQGANGPVIAELGFGAPFKLVEARVGNSGTVVTVAADNIGTTFTLGAVCDVSLWALVHLA